MLHLPFVVWSKSVCPYSLKCVIVVCWITSQPLCNILHPNFNETKHVSVKMMNYFIVKCMFYLNFEYF